MSGPHEGLTFASSQAMSLIISTTAGPITISPDGSVNIPEGMSLDDASISFWRAVEEMGFRLRTQP